jgi:outer membrane protein
MRHLLILCSFVILCSFGTEATAQKIGYINTAELLQQIPQVKEANSNIETFRNQLLKKGQEMLGSLQNKYKELERKQAAGEISPKQLEIEAQGLKAEEAKIMEFDQSSQQKIFEKSETLLAPIRQRIQKAIDDVAAENGYSYIFDYSTGFVLYGDSSADVSALVKAKLNI